MKKDMILTVLGCIFAGLALLCQVYNTFFFPVTWIFCLMIGLAICSVIFLEFADMCSRKNYELRMDDLTDDDLVKNKEDYD